MENCVNKRPLFIPLAIEEIQIKTTLGSMSVQSEWLSSRRKKDQDVGEKDLLHTIEGM
jgi:hypothetical protein